MTVEFVCRNVVRIVRRRLQPWGGSGVMAVQRTCGVMSLLTGPHHTSFSELGSLTIRLSEGERPVFAPEYAESAPAEVMAVPVS